MAATDCSKCGEPLAGHVCPAVPVMTMPATVVGRRGSVMLAAQPQAACTYCGKPGGHHHGGSVETAVTCLWRQYSAQHGATPFSPTHMGEVAEWAGSTGAQYAGLTATPRAPRGLRARSQAPTPPAPQQIGSCAVCRNPVYFGARQCAHCDVYLCGTTCALDHMRTCPPPPPTPPPAPPAKADAKADRAAAKRALKMAAAS